MEKHSWRPVRSNLQLAHFAMLSSAVFGGTAGAVGSPSSGWVCGRRSSSVHQRISTMVAQELCAAPAALNCAQRALGAPILTAGPVGTRAQHGAPLPSSTHPNFKAQHRFFRSWQPARQFTSRVASPTGCPQDLCSRLHKTGACSVSPWEPVLSDLSKAGILQEEGGGWQLVRTCAGTYARRPQPP